MKFSSLAALEVVILTISSTANGENFIKMGFPFLCVYTFHGIIFYTASDNCCHGKREVQEMTWLSQTILTGIFPSSTQLITIDGICSVTTEICRVANGPECLPTARRNIWSSWKDEHKKYQAEKISTDLLQDELVVDWYTRRIWHKLTQSSYTVYTMAADALATCWCPGHLCHRALAAKLMT